MAEKVRQPGRSVAIPGGVPTVAPTPCSMQGYRPHWPFLLEKLSCRKPQLFLGWRPHLKCCGGQQRIGKGCLCAMDQSPSGMHCREAHLRLYKRRIQHYLRELCRTHQGRFGLLLVEIFSFTWNRMLSSGPESTTNVRCSSHVALFGEAVTV